MLEPARLGPGEGRIDSSITQKAGWAGSCTDLFFYRKEGELKAANGRKDILVGSLHFEIVSFIREVSASLTSVTPPSWVFHPLPGDSGNWVPPQETTLGGRELPHAGQEERKKPGRRA